VHPDKWLKGMANIMTLINALCELFGNPKAKVTLRRHEGFYSGEYEVQFYKISEY
jgi:hypothetical protein